MLVGCQGVSAFQLDGQAFVGDLYHAGLPRWPVRLAAGSHRIQLRLRGKIQTQFACFVEKMRVEASPLHLFGESFLAAPDLVESAGSVALSSPLLSVGLANLNAPHKADRDAWIRDLRPKLVAADSVGSRSLGLAHDQPLPSSLPPGTSGRITIHLELGKPEDGRKKDEACHGEKSLRLAFEGTVAGKVVQSSPLRVKLQCRRSTQSFVYTFQDVDGSTQHAAAVLPQTDCGGRPCPVLISLSGTSISARDSADSYKFKVRGAEDYTFGVQGAWLIAPTRHGAHNWEGPGLATARGALKASLEVAQRLRAQAPDLDAILVAGHSMGGHGALLLAASLRGQLLGIASSAGWLRKDQYADSNKVLLHDVASPWVEPALATILRECEVEFDAEALAPSLVGVPILLRVGSRDRTVHPWFSRRMLRTLRAAGAPAEEAKLTEVAGQEHWWWDTQTSNDGGAVNDPEMRGFYASCLGQRQTSDRRRARWRLVVHNVATAGSKGGARILQQLHPYRRSEVSVQREDGEEICLRIRTSNVRRLEWVGASLFNLSNCRKGTSQTQPKILLDGQSLQWQDVKADDKVELCLRDRTWGPCTALARAERSGEDFGPIRQIFARGVCGIFGSEAQEENALRFLANMLLMTGHSSLPVFRDDEVLQQDGQLAPPTICEGLIVVGTPETNRALAVLLQDNHGFVPPLKVAGQSLAIEDCEWHGGSRGALSLLPWWRAGSVGMAQALVVTGSSAASAAEALVLLATPTIPPMARQPLTHLLPDYVVLDIEETRRFGPGGYLAAGFWDHRWQPQEGAWAKDCSLVPSPHEQRTEL